MRQAKKAGLFGVLFGALALLTGPARADQVGPYSGRSLTLGRGTLRIDGGPPDYGWFHPASPQWINENRGLRVRSWDGGEAAWIGGGLAYGVTDAVELGGLIAPLRLEPDAGIDDMELYGRFAFLRGDFEMGAQVTLQLPTETEFGLGVGLPMLAHATDRMRIDTGVELEVLFWDPDEVVSLDAPLALTWDVGRYGFLGLRTGLYVWDMDVVLIPAGIHGGVAVARGRVDVGGWFIWPALLGVERNDALDARTFEIGFGVNARIP